MGKSPFNAFQVEVSTRCSLHCRMCPRGFFAEEWLAHDMSMDLFEKIARCFHLTEWVHLQGWGEPLENRHLMDMLTMVKERGCLAGFTTNGVRLSEEVSGELLDRGIDNLVISIGGATRADHEKLRTGSSFDVILENVGRFVVRKRQRGMERPTVRLSFLMTRENIHGLPDTVPLAAELGVDEIMVINLDYLAGERCDTLRIFDSSPPPPDIQKSVDLLHRIGKEKGVTVRTYPLVEKEALMCEANPLRNVFFSADGSVSPCVYLRIPKRGDIPRIFRGRSLSVPQGIFGNVGEEDFLDIWNRESYREFRNVYKDRLKMRFNLRQAFEVFAWGGTGGKRKLRSLPDPCRTCYKAYGL